MQNQWPNCEVPGCNNKIIVIEDRGYCGIHNGGRAPDLPHWIGHLAVEMGGINDEERV
jgi:hypothetical protein